MNRIKNWIIIVLLLIIAFLVYNHYKDASAVNNLQRICSGTSDCLMDIHYVGMTTALEEYEDHGLTKTNFNDIYNNFIESIQAYSYAVLVQYPETKSNSDATLYYRRILFKMKDIDFDNLDSNSYDAMNQSMEELKQISDWINKRHDKNGNVSFYDDKEFKEAFSTSISAF